MTENKAPLLELKNVKTVFKVRQGLLKAVNGVSLSLYAGETLGLVGESGCGKSTLGKTIMRLYRPQEGEVRFEGRDIWQYNRREQKAYTQMVQMIFQDPYASLDPLSVIGDAVAEGLDIHRLAGTKKDRENNIMALLHDVGLNQSHVDRYPHEFSGGQRQRIGIARALVMRPKLIIADEPISALDVSIRAQVLNLLSRLRREYGLTYLFIAHDLSIMHFITDRLAVIHKGRIVELAETEKLFAHPLHPYTRALLSAIPMPDPVAERRKKLLVYDPSCHHYETDPPRWTEVEPGHFVLANAEEEDRYRTEIADAVPEVM